MAETLRPSRDPGPPTRSTLSGARASGIVARSEPGSWRNRPSRSPDAASRPGGGPLARADLRISGVLFLLMAALTVSLAGLVAGAAWWLELLLAAGVVLGVAAACRLLRAPAAVAPVAAFVALVMLVTALFAPGTAILGIIPTPATVRLFAQLAEQARVSFYSQGVPADPLPEFLFLMVAAGGVVALASDLLAVTLRRPALVGIVVASALLAPATLLDTGIPPLSVALCLVAYLLLLRTDVRRAQHTGPELGPSIAIAAGAVVVALVIGTTAPGFQQIGRQTIPASAVLFGQGVSPLINLGADLRRPLSVAVIDYSTTSLSPGYLQMTTLDSFTGDIWQHQRSHTSFFAGSATLGAVPGLMASTKTQKTTTHITVHNLTSEWLPAPYPAAAVKGLEGNWGWERNDLTISGYASSTAGQTYTVTTRTVKPTADGLRSAGTDYPGSVARDLDLPDEAPGIIAATARSVTAGATTPYDKAIALQSYFHDGDFRYSLSAPKNGGYDGDTPGTVATFLVQKAGYCVHFAAAMTLMARDLGIPARIAVGYLPGNESGLSGKLTQYTVTSDELHAWPELYFPGIGWVPFEPTVGRGTVPDYESVQANQSSATDTATPTPSGGRGLKLATDVPAPSAGSPTSSATAFTQGTGAVAVVLLLLALLLAPAVLRGRIRTRRLAALRNGTAGADVAWAELRAAAIDLGFAAPTTETPRVFADRLATTWQHEEGTISGAGDSASSAMVRLLEALERERFGADSGTAVGAVLADDVSSVIAALASAAGWARRARARAAPVSLLDGRGRSAGAVRLSG